MEKPSTETTTKKEKVNRDKLIAVRELLFGTRAQDFNALLPKAPTTSELTHIQNQLVRPRIMSVIFDLDGTLVPPYADIPQEVIEHLHDYIDDDRRVAIYTNSPHTSRLDALRDNGVIVAETGVGKPSKRGFEGLCLQHRFRPHQTAMIGNSPITDMPLTMENEEPYFPLNILVESIPPQRELCESWRKFIRAKLFHVIAKMAAAHVKLANRKLIRNAKNHSPNPSL